MKLRAKFVSIFLGVSVAPIALVIGLSIWSVSTGDSEFLSQTLLSVGFILVILVLFFALQFAKYIADPIISVAKAASRLRQGNLNERVAFVSRDELGELSQSFNQMASQIQHVDTIKSNFMDLASHHLRTPQAIIDGSISELMHLQSGLSKEQITYVELIKKGSEELHDITETLLTISDVQLGNTSPNVQTLELPTILQEMVDQFADEAAQRGIKLVIEPTAGNKYSVFVDPQLLRVALRSLVRNAITFTEKGSVRMTLERTDQTIQVHIIDTGIGIPAEDIPAMFSKFFQAKNGKDHSPTGKGLGLYLARLCVQTLGGDIKIESTLGKGSTFTLSLPVQA